MFEIKKIPEDFIVKEIMDLKINDKGDYSYFLVRKKNWSSLGLVNEISKRLKIKKNFIGIAGNKDKNAVSEQYFSFFKVNKEKVLKLNIRDVKFNFVGYGDKRINIGDLNENEFIITIRNLDNKINGRISRIKNYYDKQRFGIHNDNHLAGKYLIKKDFKSVCRLLNLEVNGNDFVGALRRTDEKLLKLYIHAYSSYLFNEVIDLLDRDYGNIPIIGFLTEFNNKEIKEAYENILNKEEVNVSDFIIKQIPNLSSEGGERKMFASVKDFKVLDFDKDELNNGRFKEVISFKLGKGSYGTLVVKEFVEKSL